jgi:hypothetical protein
MKYIYIVFFLMVQFAVANSNVLVYECDAFCLVPTSVIDNGKTNTVYGDRYKIRLKIEVHKPSKALQLSFERDGVKYKINSLNSFRNEPTSWNYFSTHGTIAVPNKNYTINDELAEPNNIKGGWTIQTSFHYLYNQRAISFSVVRGHPSSDPTSPAYKIAPDDLIFILTLWRENVDGALPLLRLVNSSFRQDILYKSGEERHAEYEKNKR